jgi:hypothetical protein
MNILHSSLKAVIGFPSCYQLHDLHVLCFNRRW